MRNDDDACEPGLPLSNSGVINATAAVVASTAQGKAPPLPPPGEPSPNSTMKEAFSPNSTLSEALSPVSSEASRKQGERKSKKSGKQKTFEESVAERGVQHKGLGIGRGHPVVNDGDEEFDLEVASHTSGLSRPSSRASQASEFSGIGDVAAAADFMQKYKMMKLLLKEKDKELQKAKEEKERAAKEEEERRRTVLPSLFGRSREPKSEEEAPLVEPPDPAEILRQVRRRRFVVLVLIFAAMVVLPVFLLQSLREEITP